MSLLSDFLDDRKVELASHISLAKALDIQLTESDAVQVGDLALSVRHLMTVKSGVIVHVYNIVEATMSRVMDDLGRAVKRSQPGEWTHEALREWLRYSASITIDGNEDTRLDVVHRAALQLLAHDPIQDLRFKKPSGTWDDKLIFRFAQRLSVAMPLNPQIAPRIAPKPAYGDKSAMEFLADRRNAIAHGSRSFEDGANDLTIAEIEEIASIAMDYMSFAVAAFQGYINDKRYNRVIA